MGGWWEEGNERMNWREEIGYAHVRASKNEAIPGSKKLQNRDERNEQQKRKKEAISPRDKTGSGEREVGGDSRVSAIYWNQGKKNNDPFRGATTKRDPPGDFPS